MPFLPLALVLLGSVGPPRFRYEVVDVPGSRFCSPVGIDDRGTAILKTDIGCFRWSRGPAVRLATLGPGATADVTAVAKDGVAIGYDYGPKSLAHIPTRWVGVKRGNLPAALSSALTMAAVSLSGQIAGIMLDGSVRVGYRWTGRNVVLLRPPRGYSECAASGIDSAGDVVGYAATSEAPLSAGMVPVVWRDGTPSIMPLPSYCEVGVATANNDHGQAIGYGVLSGHALSGDPAFWVGLLWEDRRLVDLTSQSKASKWHISEPLAINEAGQIVGRGYASTRKKNPTEVPVLWQNGIATDLNTLVALHGLTLRDAVAINKRGQILCQCILLGRPGKTVAVILTPRR